MCTKNTAGQGAVARPHPADLPTHHDDGAPVRQPRWPLAPLAVAVAATLSACAPVDKVFVVDTTDDAHDSVPGDGVCATVEGQCSLRAAFEETNATPVDTGVQIDVGPGQYALTLDAGLPYDGLTLSRGNVIVRGAGRHQTIVNGLGERRLLRIDGEHSRLISIESLSLVNGWVNEARRGGAVFISPSRASGSTPYLVSFTDTVIRDSSADFLGGGIYAEGKGTLNVIDSRVRDNESTKGCSTELHVAGGASGGGGIAVISGGTLHLIHSEVSDNCGSNGGGIRVSEPHGGEHLILGSTISGNLSLTSGGGLYLQGSGMLIEDSTFAFNEVTTAKAFEGRNAGAIHVQNSALRIESSTIVDNENPFDYENGAGGVLSYQSSVVIQNTVLAENTGPGWRECVGPLFSDGGNFLGESEPKCEFVSDPASDIVDGGDPKLGLLAGNGGPTRTMRPAADSPLIDAGVEGCEPIDQRAFGHWAPSGAACDIGAVERQLDGAGSGQVVPDSVEDLLDENAPWGDAYPELRRELERLGEDVQIDLDARPGDLMPPVRQDESGPRAFSDEPRR